MQFCCGILSDFNRLLFDLAAVKTANFTKLYQINDLNMVNTRIPGVDTSIFFYRIYYVGLLLLDISKITFSIHDAEVQADTE